MTIVTDDNTATPAPSRTAEAGIARAADEDVERALAAAVNDPARIGDLLDALRRGRLWVPLPDDGRPVTDGSALTLPTVTYLASEFVPAFTSVQQLQAGSQDPAGQRLAAPHVVVRTADLARLLPPALGIALNPGLGASVPVYPEGVAYLASAPAARASGRITVGPPPTQPDALLGGIRAGLAGVPAARDAAAAWLSVESAGEGLIISVTLDNPADAAARDAVIRVLERAAGEAPQDTGFPIDVTFPGEGLPDPIDEWISAFAAPFYLRP
ncbi:MAG TPA: SseB family protein [Streptosporangiaceae bacterium]|nr:SseB family protein [Streptosporangiaceae bacterium]